MDALTRRRADELCRRLQPYLYGVARNLADDEDTRQDFMAEGLAKICEVMDRGPDRSESYLRTCGVNAMYTALRSRSRFNRRFALSGSHEDLVDMIGSYDPSEVLAGTVAAHEVLLYVKPELREVLVSRAYDLSYAEAEAMTGTPAKLMKSRFSRARQEARRIAECGVQFPEED